MTNNTQAKVSLLRRLGAILYDGMLFGASSALIGGITGALLAQAMGVPEIAPGSIASKLLFIYMVLLGFLMVGWFWTHGGQTLGMRAWKIRVTSSENDTLQNITWMQAALRFSMGLISLIAFGVGFWIALFDPQGLTWHDRVSRTRLQYVA